VWKLLSKLFSKQPICDHSWHKIGDEDIAINLGGQVDLMDGCWIYCPRCKREELVYAERWERIRERQKVDSIAGKGRCD
jgi:hypothetical protein